MGSDFKKIDAHIHFGTDPHVASKTIVPYLNPDNPESVIQYLSEQDADIGVLFPHDRIFSPPWDADYDKQNMQVGRAANQYPNNIVGVARINPTFGAEHTSNLLDKYTSEWNCKGVKLVAGYDFYRPNDMKVMGPLLDKCEELGLTVIFHSGDAPRDLPSLQSESAKRYPNVKFQLAHMGMHSFLWEAIIAAQNNDNIWCDMSQAFTYDIAIFIEEAGFQKLVYGTDAPYQSPRVESQKVIDAAPQIEQQRAIFRDNAIKLWGLSGLAE
ncbi:unannotated protein [freshwater metagenome]|uniref:Unannotated protein n=1 Tax=freshwater metagenome TaxID=449393 RepID=A0A6J7CFQ5_9ZZZZ